jgi:RNA polymerase sigma-70 factor, ECF subfamily
MPKVIGSSYSNPLADVNAYEELDHQIQSAIDSLPPQCQLIFRKSRWEEKRYAEIAEEMNLSVKTIEAQMGKALKILREKLKDYL